MKLYVEALAHRANIVYVFTCQYCVYALGLLKILSWNRFHANQPLFQACSVKINIHAVCCV